MLRGPETLRHIFIARDLKGSAVVKTIEARNRWGIPVTFFDDAPPAAEGSLAIDPFDKTTLIVSRYKGQFLSSCPGSDGMVCCRYYVLNTGPGCIYDCHYCFLQSFLNTPALQLYGNLDAMFEEIETKVRGRNFHQRIGTGEYSDSLAIEELTGVSAALVERFGRIENVTLELKTKSNHVETLLDLDHRGNTVIAWSLNPQTIIETVEPGSASLAERLDAARRASAAGYRIAFHFDPMIHFPGWEREYHALLDELFATVQPDSIAWISLGTFRYSPSLKEVIQKRFPDDPLTREEMIQGTDGKLRYFKTVREAMYESMKQRIERVDKRLFSYLCMETRSMWHKHAGFLPASAKRLDSLFEKRRVQMGADPIHGRNS